MHRYRLGSPNTAKVLLLFREGWSALPAFPPMDRTAVMVVGATMMPYSPPKRRHVRPPPLTCPSLCLFLWPFISNDLWEGQSIIACIARMCERHAWLGRQATCCCQLPCNVPSMQTFMSAQRLSILHLKMGLYSTENSLISPERTKTCFRK